MFCQALPSPTRSPTPSDVLPPSKAESTVASTRVSTPFEVLDAGRSPQPPHGAVPQTDEGNPSWHCRSCLLETCVDPITTICGHLFCYRCFMRELGEKGCCPVCRKTFFVRLHVQS
ncbi:hypothetical protein V8D89_008242 [Ganoderma adspersum]